MNPPQMKNLTLLLLLLPFLFSLHLTSVLSWKKDEFRNCNQTPFCKRARSRKPAPSSLIATDVSISDGDLVAKITNRRDDQIKPLILSLSAYQDGILRLKIDEDHSSIPPPPRKRFEVPDVVVPEFTSKKLWLQKLDTKTLDGDSSPSSIVYLNEEYDAVLRHEPFEIYVRDKSSGKRIISLNSHGLFDFEQLKHKKPKSDQEEEKHDHDQYQDDDQDKDQVKEEKDEDEDWAETFRGHTDSRPYGPQSISFDVSFYGADFVYGIPEHATSFALKPTRGPGLEDHSEPYRLFNLDVFEYVHEAPFGLYGSIPFMISHGKSHGTSGFSG